MIDFVETCVVMEMLVLVVIAVESGRIVRRLTIPGTTLCAAERTEQGFREQHTVKRQRSLIGVTVRQSAFHYTTLKLG